MEWFREHAWEAWLGLTITLGVLELFSLDFVLVMLAAGAAVGMLAALVGAPVILQVLLAAGAAVASLALVRPTMVKRMHAGPELTLGHDKLLGRRAIVLTEITPTSSGLIRVNGEEWTARPYDETLTIASGESVEVFEIRGATAYVHPVPRLES